MKFYLKLILLLLFLFFISIATVSAENTSQIDDGGKNIIESDPISQPKGFYDLQQQIRNCTPGDTIELDDDYAFDSIRPNGIAVDRTLTLDGKGHTIDANNSSVFYIKKGITHVTFKNTIFINAEKSCGGAIFADNGSDYLTITNCTFINNRATTSNVGGAVYIKASYCTVTDNYFENNSARTSGGAMRIEGNDQIISNNIFIANKAVGILGGAINALGHNILIFNNTFKGNVAGRDGGAIDIEGTVVAEHGTGSVITNNVFDSNRVSGNIEGSHGGAISIAGQNCTISNNNFTNNHADVLGGAIRWNGVVSNSGIITQNRFEGNDARSGGAIYDNGSGLIISKNIFIDNHAVGGAGGTLDIKGSNSLISDNYITKSSTTTSGGAIYIDGKSNTLINNFISMCYAAECSGALYLRGDSATIINNKFLNNAAESIAGATLIKSSNAIIKNNEFSGNVAKSSGGAAYIEGSKITLDSNTFTKNQAGVQNVGGAVRFKGNDGIITKNKFIANTAKLGFAIYGSGEFKKLSGNTYSPKKASAEKWEKTNVKLSSPAKTFKKSAKTKKITITLKSANNKALGKKKVILTVNKKTYKATTNSKGQVTINVKLTKKGTYKYAVKFAGDTYYNSLSKKGTIKIR
ncbi:right-handed parallel beta-helix repeat-containing protein [uncultured Methanobrevibacter sp.]|uniref:right-handed parallel beta-helix repeat-containing protein n=1 Tax=uncultured Methanobrevibacter sp. TaxID=253161 RepID=UPI002639273F|nr:right-handed parallel beta-helix repeat-containing protein [uncultured Methanobrevibacter sp.]